MLCVRAKWAKIAKNKLPVMGHREKNWESGHRLSEDRLIVRESLQLIICTLTSDKTLQKLATKMFCVYKPPFICQSKDYHRKIPRQTMEEDENRRKVMFVTRKYQLTWEEEKLPNYQLSIQCSWLQHSTFMKYLWKHIRRLAVAYVRWKNLRLRHMKIKFQFH